MDRDIFDLKLFGFMIFDTINKSVTLTTANSLGTNRFILIFYSISIMADRITQRLEETNLLATCMCNSVGRVQFDKDMLCWIRIIDVTLYLCCYLGVIFDLFFIIIVIYFLKLIQNYTPLFILPICFILPWSEYHRHGKTGWYGEIWRNERHSLPWVSS